MSQDAGSSEIIDVRGTLRWNEFEGGFWSLELDEPHDELGDHVVLQGYVPAPPLADGTKASGRIRSSDEQFGFLMAGPLADVIELTPRSTT